MMSLNWMASLSRVSDSSSRHAAAKMVPPGVSYTPRLFIPTRRFSTMSIRPIPCRPPMSFSSVKRDAGESSFPFMETGIPETIPISRTYSGLSGASSGSTDIMYISLLGSFAGSSKISPFDTTNSINKRVILSATNKALKI
ncbi:hypothetical protein Hanom_Chr08g00746351 [Helianthus anomalus]